MTLIVDITENSTDVCDTDGSRKLSVLLFRHRDAILIVQTIASSGGEDDVESFVVSDTKLVGDLKEPTLHCR